MLNSSWEERSAELAEIIMNLQRELQTVTEERNKLLQERDSLVEELKRFAAESNTPAPQERLWIPADEPSKL